MEKSSMRLALIVLVVFFIVVVAGSVNIYVKSTSSSEFCADCHQEDYEVYMTAMEDEGRSIAKAHRDEGLSCWDCHAENMQAFLSQEFNMFLISYLDYPATVDLTEVRDTCVKCHVWDLPVHAVKYDEIHQGGEGKCAECHPGYEEGTVRTTIQPHEDVETCGGCHYVHESVLDIGDFMKRDCSDCHELPHLAGGHSGIQCAACHMRHALIPNCTLCHSSHTGEAMYNEGCAVCHESAHQPGEAINYPANTSKDLCSECHVEQLQTSAMYNEAHNYAVTKDVNLMDSCTDCHPTHGEIVDCLTGYCHGNRVHYEYHPSPDCDICHSSPMKKCVTCHKDPHAARASLDW